jgi:hypothetical protein
LRNLQYRYSKTYSEARLNNPKFHKTLEPLYTQYPNMIDNKLFVAFMEGFMGASNVGMNYGALTSGLANKGRPNTTQQLQELANKANQAVPGQGTVSGTLKHTEFAKQVKGLNNSLLQPEVTYKNGQIVPYGTKGGVRLDDVEYNANGTIKAVYDLKTGKAGLTNSRIQDIQNHLPNNAPVYEIRPK